MKLLPMLLALGAALPAQAARYTYHGELLDGGAPADGRYDLRVQAFAQPGAKTPLAAATELPGIVVVDGRFSVELELPEDADGTTWIDVAVRSSDDGAYVSLGDPQPISKVNSTCPGAWALDGNSGVPAGSFLGLADPASGTPLELRARNLAVARFVPGPGAGIDAGAPQTVLGAHTNRAIGAGATVGGGGSTSDFSGSACPSCANQADARFATVAGGQANHALDEYAAIGGGQGNTASMNHAAIAGGYLNRATELATVAGGMQNRAEGYSSAVAGGALNRALGNGAMVPGGALNCAGGDFSFAGGRNAVVRHGPVAPDMECNQAGSEGSDLDGDEGTFVWADSQSAGFVSSGADQFLVRARGGVGINAPPTNAGVELTITSAPGIDYPNVQLRQRAAGGPGILFSAGDATGANNAGFYIDHFNAAGAQSRRLALYPDGRVFVASSASNPNVGAELAAGSGTWNSASDRRLKTAIAAIDPTLVLQRVLALPVSSWSYIAQGEGVRHIGPMAQDFAAAFGVGENDTTISTVDADGVALAALQGLNAKLEAENAALRAEQQAQAARIDALLARVTALEAARD